MKKNTPLFTASDAEVISMDKFNIIPKALTPNTASILLLQKARKILNVNLKYPVFVDPLLKIITHK
jgi:hypothetical protein